MVVQATEDGHCKDPPDPVNGSVNWGGFVQRQVSPELVVISDVACDDATEVSVGTRGDKSNGDCGKISFLHQHITPRIGHH
jgi:hypothetical protein